MSTLQDSVETNGQAPSNRSPRRTVSKDHLHTQAGHLAMVGDTVADFPGTDPLVFWTMHPTKPCLVDLREFADGKLKQCDADASGGRRALIEQLVPAFKARHSMAAPKTIATIQFGLRKWWLLFDVIEAEERMTLPHDALVKRLTSVLDLGALHGSRAVQSGMSKNDFHSFVVLADITRLALGVSRPLHWPSPAKGKRRQAVVLPPEHTKALYHGTKADWHAALDRWALADGLAAGPAQGGFVAGESPVAIRFRNDLQRATAEDHQDQAMRERQRLATQCERERILAESLGLWKAAATRLGHVDLVRQDLVDSAGQQALSIKAFNISDVAEALYPNGLDIRSSFHLCLAVGGLNTSVLLDLRLDLSAGMEMPKSLVGPNVDEAARRQWVIERSPFLVQSPIEGEYYIEGWKDRAKSWVSRSYKWKQHLTPGPILIELIVRTWPLRAALNRRLELATDTLDNAIKKGANPDALNELRQRVLELTDAVRSVWLYRGMRNITWLSGSDCHTVRAGEPYLQLVTRQLNKGRRAQGQPDIEPMEPKRFRDAYAAWALDYSGGEVLAVMVALDHRQLSTTDSYLDNTAVRIRVAKKYRTFSQALFGSLGSGRLDPTLIALETRFAAKALEERSRMAARLAEYRNAVKSRYDVGCRDPHHPSALADPAFEADGIKSCTAHRCTLCSENAVITPEAYPGLMLRQAELEIREENSPVAEFVLSSFDAELRNVRTALLPVKDADPERLASTVEFHKREIREGKRKVPGFSVKPM